jgi:hypothetical protein
MIPDSMISDSEQPSSSLPPYFPRAAPDSLTKSTPLSIPAPRSGLSSCSSSSEVSPPPFVSTVPKTPPSYVGSPQGSPKETPTIVLTRPSISSTQSIPTIYSLPSSLDDFVPSLPPTPPAHQRKSTSKRPSLESLPALNPTSSRFTLSIPLLGRPKIPLDRVLGLRDSKKDEGLSECHYDWLIY